MQFFRVSLTPKALDPFADGVVAKAAVDFWKAFGVESNANRLEFPMPSNPFFLF